MRIGAHVDPADPLAAAAARGADVVQFFLTDPQGYKTPEAARRRRRAEGVRRGHLHPRAVLVNVAHPNNRIRIPSRKLLMAHARAAAELGAKGLIVHGGHVGEGADLAAGFENWRKAFAVRGEGRRPAPADPDREHRRRRQRDAPGASTTWPGCGTRSASSGPGSAWTPATRTPAARSCSASSTGSRRSPAAST